MPTSSMHRPEHPTSRRPIARPLVAALALAAAAMGAHAGEARVTCHVTYGGETRHIDAPATRDPLGVAPVSVGSYFLFRVVLQTQPADQAGVRIEAFADKDEGPAMIHQARYTPAQLRQAGRQRGSAGGFTGWQTVYEPVRDGELQYWCEWHAASGAPAGADTRKTRPAPATRASADASVRLVFAGDVMLDDGPGRTIAAGGDPLAPFATLLRDADYTIGNLECPIASTGQPLDSKIYSFRADPQVLRVLKGRFDAMAVSNNHSGDQGREAFMQTLAHLRSAGIAAFGGGENLRAAHRPLWIDRHGLRIAVLGYNEFKPRSFEAGATWPGIAWSDDAEVVADIRAARQAGADLVIPFMHWGWEREPNPTERQRQLARLMVDAGADAVVGGHPHVTQGADTYRGRPIIWSLGNFVFDGFDLPPARVGWVLRLTLDRRGVRHWQTLQARMDDAGTPTPEPDALTPCGWRGQPVVMRCSARDTPGQ